MSPTPWRWQYGEISDVKGMHVASSVLPTDGEIIVAAVNAHAELVAMLRRYLEAAVDWPCAAIDRDARALLARLDTASQVGDKKEDLRG